MGRLDRTVSPTIAAVWLLVLGCLILTIVDNLRLRAQVTDLSGELERNTQVPIGPAPGPVSALDADGDSLTDPLDRETPVVLVASFGCVFSRSTMARWRELAMELPDTKFVLLRVDGPPAKWSRGGKDGAEPFAFPGRPELNWMTPSPSTRTAYRLGYVPQTIVARRGEVVFVRTGPLTLEDVARIRKAVS